MRPKQGNEFWNQKTQFIVFYDNKDELPVAIFDTLWELVEYRGYAKNKSNYDLTLIDLYRALKSDNGYTRMLGRPMTVYIMDKDDLDINLSEENEEK